MRGRLALWLRAQMEVGVFWTKADILTLVLNSILVATALATSVYLVAAAILSNIGLLPYPLHAAPGFGSATAILISASVIALLAWLIGMTVRELSLSRAAFERLSLLDPQSGLLNRPAFVEAMAGMKENGFFVLFDVDRFKAVNDRHGRAIGDEVIVAVSEELQRVFLPNNLVGRFGGEEFAAFIPNDDRGDCCLLVEEARRSVAARRVAAGDGFVAVTLSVGIADRPTSRPFETVLESADRALYLAKSFGRDRAVHEDQSEELLEPSRRAAAGGRRR